MQDYDNLQNFLEHVALATSIDQEWEGAKINLMTMHAAKGLERCSISSWMGRGTISPSKIFRGKGRFRFRGREKISYVGMMRVKKEAYLSFAMKEYIMEIDDALPSRFISEIPDESVEKNEIGITDTDDFEFNQDNTIEFDEEYSPGWDRYKKQNA